MHQDSDNTDHKDGRVFVFDDRLGFDHDVKYQLEATLDYPFEDRTTFAASVDPSVLTAEKKRKPDGSPYILVRKATFSEQRELFANDGEIAVGEGAAGADAAAVAIDGLITRSDVHQA